ncbi:hypothetical protein JW905_02510 [bacterium]|nr:hypothetical protein [candidate division CSSED10-310 bacterium]
MKSRFHSFCPLTDSGRWRSLLFSSIFALIIAVPQAEADHPFVIINYALPGKSACFYYYSEVFDVNGNGMPEVSMPGQNHYTFLMEPQGCNQFEFVHTVDFRGLLLSAMGDINGNGLPEYIGESKFINVDFNVVILESPAPNAYPSVEIYRSPLWSMFNGQPTVSDLDMDGKQEVLFTNYSTDRLEIYEYDETHFLVKKASLEGVRVGTGKLTGDFDLDGRNELILAACNDIYIWECDGDDSYRLEWFYHYKYGFQAVHFGDSFLHDDFDGDGRPELVMAGTTFTSAPVEFVEVVESDAPDSYYFSYEFMGPAIGCGVIPVVKGDFDGDGLREFAAYGALHIMFFKSTGDNAYEMIYDIPNRDPILWCRHREIEVADFNGNGYDELLLMGCRTGDNTILIEHRDAPRDELPPETSPGFPDRFTTNAPVTVLTGTATDDYSGVARVEVSTDGGLSWRPAAGAEAWRYYFAPDVAAGYEVLARAVDGCGRVGAPGPARIVEAHAGAVTVPHAAQVYVDLAAGDEAPGPGERLSVAARLFNSGAPVAVAVVVVLEVAGRYWFYPAWTEPPDALPVHLDQHQESDPMVLVDLVIPDIDIDDSLVFWAGCLDAETGDLLGPVDRLQVAIGR